MKSDVKILLFGGTTEGRRLAQSLSDLGYQVCVCVATGTGAEYLKEIPRLRVLTGRKDTGQMAALMEEGFACCVDATHPYAVEATSSIRAACRQTGLEYRRLLRKQMTSGEVLQRVSELVRIHNTSPVTDTGMKHNTSPAADTGMRHNTSPVTDAGMKHNTSPVTDTGMAHDTSKDIDHKKRSDVSSKIDLGKEQIISIIGDIKADTASEACLTLMELMKPGDNVLLTTGAREASCFAALLKDHPDRIWIRVLPSEQSIQQCLEAGFVPDRILTGYGPYDAEENASVLKRCGITYLVTKDGGTEGGYPEKLAAAYLRGVKVITIRRPKEEGLSEEELLNYLDAL